MIDNSLMENPHERIHQILNGKDLPSKMFRSVLISVGLYDIAIEYLPELLTILYDSERGREIIAIIEAKFDAKNKRK